MTNWSPLLFGNCDKTKVNLQTTQQRVTLCKENAFGGVTAGHCQTINDDGEFHHNLLIISKKEILTNLSRASV